MAFSPNAETVYADGPFTAPRQPSKAEIRALLKQYEAVIDAFTSNGGLIYTSKAQMDADLLHAAKSSAWVIGDANVALNGIYQKQGASGAGSWTRVGNLPYSFIIASDVGAGTANAIQATSSIPVNSSALVWMNIFEANTASPVTVSFNGGSTLTIKTNSGNNVAAGGLVAGMIVLGIVSGSTFRLLSDQVSSAIVAAAEAAQVAAAASAGAASTSAGAAATSAASAAASAATALSGRTINTTNGITGGGTLAADKTLTLEAQLGLTYSVITDAKPAAISSGRYQTAAGATNAPDSTNSYFYDVIGNNGGYATVVATDFANPNRIWTASEVASVWSPWQLQNPKNLLTWGASPLGVVSATAAINAACAFQTGRLIGTAAFASIPQAPVIDLEIPAGNWHVATLVDTGNKNVTYYVDENATFTAGSMDNLNAAKIVRKNRTTSNQMSGVLDSANVKSAMGGDGAADRSPLVNGITNVNQISSIDTWDAVTDYVDITGVALLHTSTATFTSSTCTIASAVNVLKLRVGMVVLTSNNYAGQILSWNGAGTVITVTGWYPIGSTVPGTPAAATVYLNPISEVYARNTNVFLPFIGYTYQGTAHEMGLINNKVAPSTAEDPAGKTWMSDAVWLGGYRGSIGHITRGDWWEGFRATGTQKGFVAKGYASLGYAAPLVGFEYEGSGNALVARNAAGTAMAYLEATTGRMLAQRLVLFALTNAANDAAAASAGVPVGEAYRNGSVLMIRVT